MAGDLGLGDLITAALGNAAPNWFGDPRLNFARREAEKADILRDLRQGISLKEQAVDANRLEDRFDADFAARAIGMEKTAYFKQAQQLNRLAEIAGNYLSQPITGGGTYAGYAPEQGFTREGVPMETSLYPRLRGPSIPPEAELATAYLTQREPTVQEVGTRAREIPAFLRERLYGTPGETAQAAQERLMLNEQQYQNVELPGVGISQGTLAVNQGNLAQRQAEFAAEQEQRGTGNLLEAQRITALTHPDLSPADARLLAEYRTAKPGSLKFKRVERRMGRRGLLDRPGLDPRAGGRGTVAQLTRLSKRFYDVIDRNPKYVRDAQAQKRAANIDPQTLEGQNQADFTQAAHAASELLIGSGAAPTYDTIRTMLEDHFSFAKKTARGVIVAQRFDELSGEEQNAWRVRLRTIMQEPGAAAGTDTSAATARLTGQSGQSGAIAGPIEAPTTAAVPGVEVPRGTRLGAIRSPEQIAVETMQEEGRRRLAEQRRR